MTPFEFADKYHQLQVEDSLLGLNVNLNISKYKADWAQEDVNEASAVLDLVAKRFLRLRGVGDVPAVFQISNNPKVDPSEQFCCAGIRRAFASRGSTGEMADALRIAFLVGRATPTPKEYAEKWFGQDCNAFAGNWLGLSPMIAIGAYATGTGLGTTYSEQDCRSFLPLPPRNDESQNLWGIQMGDALLTFGEQDKRGIPWRHIAIVQSLTGSLGSATLYMAEWGEKGGKPQHNHGPYPITLIPDLLAWKPTDKTLAGIQASLKKAMPNKKLIGFVGNTPQGTPGFRIFFGQGAAESLDTRGWHTGHREFGH
jgi:hypothetical protein